MVGDVRGDALLYARKAARKIIACFRLFRERGIYEDRIMRKVKAFVDGYVYYRDCIALSLCGGGCPYSADMRHGSIWELDDVFCVHAKMTVEFLIRDLIEKMAS